MKNQILVEQITDKVILLASNILMYHNTILPKVHSSQLYFWPKLLILNKNRRINLYITVTNTVGDKYRQQSK